MSKKDITAPLNHEAELYLQGYQLIGGVDEVGRGCIAGPVAACVAVLPKGVTIKGVTDSKKLTPSERERLAALIKKVAIGYRVEFVTADVIDAMGIEAAIYTAMTRAAEL